MTERAAYWSGHLAAIEREGITTRAYAAREGLSVGALYQWRRALESRVLAAACRLRLGGGVTLELTSLPSAGWLASVVEALG